MTIANMAKIKTRPSSKILIFDIFAIINLIKKSKVTKKEIFSVITILHRRDKEFWPDFGDLGSVSPDLGPPCPPSTFKYWEWNCVYACACLLKGLSRAHVLKANEAIVSQPCFIC